MLAKLAAERSKSITNVLLRIETPNKLNAYNGMSKAHARTI